MRIDWPMVVAVLGLVVSIILFLIARSRAAVIACLIVVLVSLVYICVHLLTRLMKKRLSEMKLIAGIAVLCCTAATVVVGMAGWPESFERKLSDGQMASLRNILAEHPGAIEIAVPMQDVEADRYAEQFDAAFRRANWKVQGVDSLWESRPAVGIVVRYKKGAQNQADFVISALIEIGLKPDKVLIPTDKSTANNSDLMLLLGKKP